MHFKFFSSFERFLTHSTNEFSFSQVGTFMSDQIFPIYKSFFANFTSKLFHVRMDKFVPMQVISGFEGLTAVYTFKSLNAKMTLYMHINVSLLVEFFTTEIARINYWELKRKLWLHLETFYFAKITQAFVENYLFPSMLQFETYLNQFHSRLVLGQLHFHLLHILLCHVGANEHPNATD